MPRYNQSTVQQGQVADPTAGLANLAQEAKSQDELNKQQRQRYAAVRQAIAVKGLMGKVGVKSTSGGNIEITGAEGGMSDSDAKKHIMVLMTRMKAFPAKARLQQPLLTLGTKTKRIRR